MNATQSTKVRCIHAEARCCIIFLECLTSLALEINFTMHHYNNSKIKKKTIRQCSFLLLIEKYI